jgi:hypothetical protein
MKATWAFRSTTIALLALTSAGISGCTQAGRVLVKIDQQKLQRKIGKRFPKTIGKLAIRIRIEKPQLRLDPKQNRIVVAMPVTGTLLGVPLAQTRAVVSGGIRYQRKNATVYLTDPRIERLEATRLPPRVSERVRGVLQRFVSRHLTEIPIHRLRGNRNWLKRALLHKAWVCQNKLCLEIGI